MLAHSCGTNQFSLTLSWIASAELQEDEQASFLSPVVLKACLEQSSDCRFSSVCSC